jgi:hypothetical protein
MTKAQRKVKENSRNLPKDLALFDLLVARNSE